MEVIYYMRNYYPLTAAQKMHHNWILDYGTQQVSGVSVVASVQAELDFGLLKKCIQMETERSGLLQMISGRWKVQRTGSFFMITILPNVILL